MNLIIIFALAVIVSMATRVSSNRLPNANVKRLILITPIDHQMDLLASIHQLDNDNYGFDHEREPYDPYNAYYFYPKSLNRPRYERYEIDSYDGDALINRRDIDYDNRIETKNGQRYKYTPLFQYKSTQSRRRKLFVPNLFG